jgi:hypothetical protein
MAVPGAPTALVATAGDHSLSIAFTATAATPAVTGYQTKVGSAGWKTNTATGSPLIVDGLVNGKEVTVQIRAINADGNGTAASTTGTPLDPSATDNNGWTDANPFANPGAAVPQLDYNDPDD